MIRRFALAALAVVGTALPVAAQSDNPDFRRVNRSGVTINEYCASSSADSGWGRGCLGQSVLPSGQCVNDIRVVFAHGRSQEHRQADTCGLTNMTFQ